MRQSLLVAFAVLACHGASPCGADLAAALGPRPIETADLAWTSGAGRESTPSPDATPLRILEGKREKNENEDDTEAPIGLGACPESPHKLPPPAHARSHAPRELAAALGPPRRLARMRC